MANLVLVTGISGRAEVSVKPAQRDSNKKSSDGCHVCIMLAAAPKLTDPPACVRHSCC